MKACAQCRYFDDGWGYSCSHPATAKPDFISGTTMPSCREARAGGCGQEAKLFEPRKPWWKIWRAA